MSFYMAMIETVILKKKEIKIISTCAITLWLLLPDNSQAAVPEQSSWTKFLLEDGNSSSKEELLRITLYDVKKGKLEELW